MSQTKIPDLEYSNQLNQIAAVLLQCLLYLFLKPDVKQYEVADWREIGGERGREEARDKEKEEMKESRKGWRGRGREMGRQGRREEGRKGWRGRGTGREEEGIEKKRK